MNATWRRGKLHDTEPCLAYSKPGGFTQTVWEDCSQTVFTQTVNWKQVLSWVTPRPAPPMNCPPAWTACVAPTSQPSGPQLILNTEESPTLPYLIPLLVFFPTPFFFSSLLFLPRCSLELESKSAMLFKGHLADSLGKKDSDQNSGSSQLVFPSSTGWITNIKKKTLTTRSNLLRIIKEYINAFDQSSSCDVQSMPFKLLSE